MKASDVFNQNDGRVTCAYYAELAARGFFGELAVALFRAQKRSTAAKRYRGRYRHAAYEVKNYSLGEICRLLSQTHHNLGWGWKRDPETPGFEWVLYVELPTGQVSFHSAERLRGPDYRGDFDRQRGMSGPRILAFCDAVMSCNTEIGNGHIAKIDRPSDARMCRCAEIRYRNNEDGSRDYKTVSRSGCVICSGTGWILQCPRCGGAGIEEGGAGICRPCRGTGSVPALAGSVEVVL